MPEDISAAERMVAEWQNRATERAQKFEAMRSQVEQISVTESSRDGSIRVTVGSNGLLQDLQLSESAGNRPMSQVSAEIMQAVRKAQSRIPELMRQAVADTVGTDDTAAQHVLSEARRHFPEPPEEDRTASSSSGIQEMTIGIEDDDQQPPRQAPPPPRPAPRRRPDDSDDDDWGERSFLR